MSAIAEGLVGGLATAAEADHCPTGEIVFSTGGVIDLKVAFDPQRTILVNRNLSGHRTEISLSEAGIGKSPVSATERGPDWLGPLLRRLQWIDWAGGALLGELVSIGFTVVGVRLLADP